LSERQPVDVAVGVLIDADGRFLLTSRPEGKVYAGYWEFPGGKVEPGESVRRTGARVARELGITIGASHPWQELVMDYPHARVRLHFCKVYDWQGAFEMREGQAMAWETLPVASRPVLPGTIGSPMVRCRTWTRRLHPWRVTRLATLAGWIGWITSAGTHWGWCPSSPRRQARATC
jgi:8-oxo-dGTP diphosphatase